MSRKAVVFLVLIFGFSLVLIVQAYKNVSSSYQSISDQVQSQQFKRLALTEMYNAARERSLLLLQMLTEEDEFELDELVQNMSSQASLFINAKERLDTAYLTIKEQELLDYQNRLTAVNAPLQNSVANMILNGNRDDAGDLLYNEAIPKQNAILEKIANVIYLGAESDKRMVSAVQNRLKGAQIQFALILSGTILGVLAVLFFFYRASRTEQELLLTKIAMKEQESNQLSFANNRLSTFTDALSTFTFMLTPQGRIELVNQSAIKESGQTLEEFQGEFLYDCFWWNYDHRLATALKRDIRNCAQGKTKEQEVTIQYAEGKFIDVHFILTPIFDELGQVVHLVAEAQDITDRKKYERKISHQASHDSLTGLINRYEFEDRLFQLIQTAGGKQSHFVFYMDLDQFKIVNDTCGHTAGDELLRQVPNLIQPLIRKEDTLARLGGDEFAILLADSDLQAAEELARRVIKSVKDYQFYWQENSFRIGVSIGIVEIKSSMVQPSEVLKWTDSACYAAKDKGRNTFHLYSNNDETLIMREQEMGWVSRIDQAIEEDRLQIYAQEIKEIEGNRRSCELLVRLDCKDDGLIPPGAFLPAAERYNKAMKVDQTVFTKAFKLMSESSEFIEQLEYCSMNVSAQSITDTKFLDFAYELFSSDRNLASKVCIEITETSMIGNMTRAVYFIESLKELGVRFALDDFGSGLSSFGYLKNLPVDYLKIDGMFVKDIHDDPIDYAMVKSIHEVANIIGLRTIAEFVEDKKILEDLQEIGVDFAQGYYLGKPIPFEKFCSHQQ